MSATSHVERPETNKSGGGASASDLVGLLFLAALAVGITRFVDGALPVILAAAAGALVPRAETGKSAWATRAPMAIVAALIALFTVKMWPLAAGELPEVTTPIHEAPHLLSWLLAIPFIGAVIVLLIPRSTPGIIVGTTLTTMAATLVTALPILSVPMGRTYHFNHDFLWMPKLGIHYHVAVDGISLWLVMLTVFIMPIATYVSFGSITTRLKDWCFALLLLESAMIGTFIALDLFLFYAFFELTLVPMYVMIGVWGRQQAHLRDAEVLPLHVLRLAPDARGRPVHRVLVRSRDRRAVVRLLRSLQRLLFDRDTVQIWLFFAFALSFSHQSADVAGAHLAARRAHRSTDRRLDHPRGRDAQDGNVRLHALLPGPLPRSFGR